MSDKQELRDTIDEMVDNEESRECLIEHIDYSNDENFYEGVRFGRVRGAIKTIAIILHLSAIKYWLSYYFGLVTSSNV